MASIFTRDNVTLHRKLTIHVAGFDAFHILKMLFSGDSYLGWFAKLGGSGGKSIGIPSEVCLLVEFPLAILQILLIFRIKNYANRHILFIANCTWRLSSDSIASFCSSTNKNSSFSSDGQVIFPFTSIEMSNIINITCK